MRTKDMHLLQNMLILWTNAYNKKGAFFLEGFALSGGAGLQLARLIKFTDPN